MQSLSPAEVPENSFRLVLQHNVHSKFLEKFGKFHVTPYIKFLKLGPPLRLTTPLRLVTPTIQQGHHIRLLMRPMRASSNPVLFTRMTSAPSLQTLGQEKLFQHLSLFGLHRAYWIGLYRYDMYMEYTRYPCFICFDKSLLFFVTSRNTWILMGVLLKCLGT